MEFRKPTIFIVIDNDLILKDLCNYLREDFGQSLNLFTFKTKDNTLSHLDENPDMVILDQGLGGESTANLQDRIKNTHAGIKVIMLTTNYEVGKAINELFNLPINAMSSNRKPMKRFPAMIYKAAVYPINLLTREFKVSRFVAIFILTFLTVGVAAFLGYFIVY